ncbi:MAG: YicC family protein [Betaproteobacteria bacterium]|nr:YicC family protein [Betaproteobacteria bacterium]
MSDEVGKSMQSVVSSMTGYASVAAEQGGQRVTVELRSVNSRYLEIHFRLADEVRSLEPQLRERLQRELVRGKVECRIAVQTGATQAPSLALNEALLYALAGIAGQVAQAIPAAAPLSVADVLRWPGMLDAGSATALEACGLKLLDEAMLALQLSRRREGAALAQHLRERVEDIRARLAELGTHLPRVLAEYRNRLARRFAEVVVSAGEERIAQELVLFAQRTDVDEECSRLAAHLQAVEALLDRGGPVGKPLDFLMQELNREANTLASKSVAAAVTNVALELKVLIEQMREQVQNLE